VDIRIQSKAGAKWKKRPSVLLWYFEKVGITIGYVDEKRLWPQLAALVRRGLSAFNYGAGYPAR